MHVLDEFAGDHKVCRPYIYQMTTNYILCDHKVWCPIFCKPVRLDMYVLWVTTCAVLTKGCQLGNHNTNTVLYSNYAWAAKDCVCSNNY